jgi:regulator of protease activity HflC (stomatin/prohibitin superfamily)
MKKTIVAVVIVLAIGYLGTSFVWKWMICHQWCDPGESIILKKKTGESVPMNSYAQNDKQAGVQEQMLGPGRYLDINPWKYDIVKAKDVIVPPGYLYLVNNTIGKQRPEGAYLAKEGEQGVQEAVLTPGGWRINTFGQQLTTKQPIPATYVGIGYVGVQTIQNGPRKGVINEVLTTGYYYNNPMDVKIHPVEIGYMEWEVHVTIEEVTIQNPDGTTKTIRRPKEGTGISFPLADGKKMYLDMTVIWGVFPKDAPKLIRDYGTDWDAVVEKVIEPQIVSICKNNGSNLTTKQFIEGTTREEFQDKITQDLQKIGEEKGLKFLVALVRWFYPDEEIKTTIQEKKLAEEERITLAIERERDTIAAQYSKAQKEVQTGLADFDAETNKLVGKEKALGEMSASLIKADADQQVASLDKKTAETEAEITKTLGQAKADVVEAMRKADASRFKLLVEAYGNAETYNAATLAKALSDDLGINFTYAGPGTFWTDSTNLDKSLVRDLADKANK